jgi:hypothetical protein
MRLIELTHMSIHALKRWTEIVKLRPDVESGSLAEAVFAIDLGAVATGEYRRNGDSTKPTCQGTASPARQSFPPTPQRRPACLLGPGPLQERSPDAAAAHLKADMRAYFGTYAKACRRANELLFRAGDFAAIDEACGRSPVNKLLPDDLHIHTSDLGALEPLLRVYEGSGPIFAAED